MKLVRNAVEKALPDAAETAIKEIRDRTERGEYPSGGTPPPYSKGYIKFRYKKLQDSPVNWRLTGAMMRGLHFLKFNSTSGIITAADEDKNKAFWISGGNSRIPARKFFVQGKEMMKAVSESFRSAILKGLR